MAMYIQSCVHMNNGEILTDQRCEHFQTFDNTSRALFPSADQSTVLLMSALGQRVNSRFKKKCLIGVNSFLKTVLFSICFEV